MNINNLAGEIVELVQQETANKTNITKINRQVVNILNKIVRNFSDTEDDEYVIAVNLNQGLPTSVLTNHPNLNGALFVCTDDISVADDIETSVNVTEDSIVVGVGEVQVQDDMSMYRKPAHKFERQSY